MRAAAVAAGSCSRRCAGRYRCCGGPLGSAESLQGRTQQKVKVQAFVGMHGTMMYDQGLTGADTGQTHLLCRRAVVVPCTAAD